MESRTNDERWREYVDRMYERERERESYVAGASNIGNDNSNVIEFATIIT